MNRRRILVVAAAGLCAAVWTYACGDGATEPPTPPPDPPRPATVAVAPATVRLTALGATEQLTAEVRDQNGNAMAGAAVSWASSAAAVAAVSNAGLVTAAGNGTATITAAAGSASGSAAVTVAQKVSAVAITPAAVTVVTGDTLRLAAEAADANGHPVARMEFDWASSDTLVAVVDDAGLVTGIGAGETEVTATAAGVTGRAELTVVTPVPTTVAVTPDTVALTALGQTAQLAAEARDQIGRVMEGVPVSWSSADTTVAAVDSAGLVTAFGGGATTIAATAGEVSGTAAVTVMQSAGSVVVSPAADTVAPGDTLRLAAQAFDENGHPVEGAEFGWSSSDVSVATVDGGGLVTGVAEGTATIVAAAGSGRGTAQITVENPDRAALVALYNATDGPNWLDNENWLTDAALGEWYGVDTDAEGRVSRLALSGNSLTGPIPAEVGNLANLRRLYLPGNELTGPIPAEVGNLANLRQLYLPENELTGAIPAELGRLANLTELHLYRNNLTGLIPPELGKLANLTELVLRANSLTGPIPPELANLQNLERLSLPASVCVPAELRAWAVERSFSVFPCNSEGRLLPSVLLREDGNGLSLALPDDLREPSAVTIDDPSVVAVSVADGWLELVPRGRGSAEVEVVPSGGGAPASARVVVRAAVGTFGIDIVMDRPAPVSYEKALTTGADWWSSVLDGTEWPDRRPTCFNDRATALADELLIHASIDLDTQVSGYAHTCFRSSGEQAALDPGGGGVTSAPHSSTLPLVRHEIGHLLGLVLWQPETGLVTGDGAYFVGPRAVKAFRESGGDPGLPGVPLSPDRAHWAVGVKDFMASFRPEGAISAAALADAGYTVDMTKANTLLGPYNAQAVVDPAGDVVPAETRRLPSDGSGEGGPPR